MKKLKGSIENLDDLADFLEFKPNTLAWLAYRCTERYRHYSIPKSNGKVRKISEPIGNLKIIQKRLSKLFAFLYENQLRHLENHQRGFKRNAHGFLICKSIVTNAKLHVGKSWVLNLDFADFFPSFNEKRIYFKVLVPCWWSNEDGKKEIFFSEKVASYITRLCCFTEIDGPDLFGLPQGAPTSPILSNLASLSLDKDLNFYTGKRKIEYSRYADDLSFSPKKDVGHDSLVKSYSNGSRSIVQELNSELEDLFQRHGMNIQEKKTRLSHRNTKMEVTGLVVSKFPNVPRREIRWVRSLLDLWETRGYKFAQDRFYKKKSKRGAVYRHKRCKKQLTHVIMGKLLFISSIRGRGDYVFLKLRRKFLVLCSKLSPELADEMTKNLGKIRLEETCKRPRYHFNHLKGAADLKCTKICNTELGSWAYERLHIKIGWGTIKSEFSNYAHHDGGASILQLAIEAEITAILALNEKRYGKLMYGPYSKLYNRIGIINGNLCGKLFMNKEFRDSIKKTDWPKYFSRMNDEFDCHIKGFEKWDHNILLNCAGDESQNKQPFKSYIIWLALNGIEAIDDYELMHHKEAVSIAFNDHPTLGRVYHELHHARVVEKESRQPSLDSFKFREYVLYVLKAIGSRLA